MPNAPRRAPDVQGPIRRSWEPVVAHGARMSWAGLLRSGDPFCPSARSRRATLTEEAGVPLRRFYGTWSARYRRFCTNLSSPKVVVRPVEPDHVPGRGIQCILHWVCREDLLRTDSGGVCRGDGWPLRLWECFTDRLGELPAGSVGEMLEAYRVSVLDRDVPIVEEWRDAILGTAPRKPPSESQLGEGWIPVPARVESPSGPAACIFSWSPSTFAYRSLQEAIGSPEAKARHLDLTSQAVYYLECQLAKLHGVTFGPGDTVEDRWFEHSSPFGSLVDRYQAEERLRIADPSKGRLDRFG